MNQVKKYFHRGANVSTAVEITMYLYVIVVVINMFHFGSVVGD